MTRAERRRALLVSSLVVVTVALPAVRMLGDRSSGDGFPLSTYPMFAEDHGDRLELPTVVHVTATGTERLSPRRIAGTDQVIQAWKTVRAAVARGPHAARELCEEVAARAAEPATFAVVIERYDTLAWAADPASAPEQRRTVVTCRSR